MVWSVSFLISAHNSFSSNRTGRPERYSVGNEIIFLYSSKFLCRFLTLIKSNERQTCSLSTSHSTSMGCLIWNNISVVLKNNFTVWPEFPRSKHWSEIIFWDHWQNIRKKERIYITTYLLCPKMFFALYF